MLSSQEQRQRIAEELARISRLSVKEKAASTTPAEPATSTNGELEPIAVIGLSGYFPGCMSVDAFWQAVEEDRCLIQPTPPERMDLWSRIRPGRDLRLERGLQGGGFIPDIKSFAPEFFKIPPGQAHRLDPRQRLLLMSVYHTLADAGYAPDSLRQQSVGVFIGIEEDEYFQILSELGLLPAGGDGLGASLVANRISWFFDWRGPSEVVNTMCSGGAVALHRAVVSLRSGESSMAIVGAANLLLRPEPFLQLGQTGQLSPDLAVRSFGKEANGFLRAEGAASALLKRLAQAEADGDPIYAVIRHTAVNYNGQGGMSMAAPDIAAHADLITRCYRQAGIDPRCLQYIEAQGMGQPVADLAEWLAFDRALSRLAAERGVSLAPGACRVGTLKPMTGHMHSASALGALFKIIHCLRTATIHKIHGFTELNPDLENPGQPCAPARSTEPWPDLGLPRLAGLHAYGAGGNNAHLLIEEYPHPRRCRRVPDSPLALKEYWFDHLAHHPPIERAGQTEGPSEQAESMVRTWLSRYREVPPEQIDLDAAFVDQGFSSILVAELASELRRQYNLVIEPARFFEFKTPRQLVRALAEFTGRSALELGADSPREEKESPTPRPGSPGALPFTPIAIIGVAGRYPASDSMEEFWDNLRAGRDCITEIPGDRWPLEEHFDPNPETAARNGKSYSKWGGFISGLHEFDPLFFKISPLEAETMNPKERLVLQTVWHTLEDAGHTPDSLLAERVGVFFGVTRAGWDAYPGTFSSVANRVSYFCDFHGPSLSIDTMCSSSLAAIHEACQNLQTGSCDLAVAGGVNLYLHPSHFVVLAHGRFLSPDGQCRPFGAGANGMTPGEGVGAVLLKPLDKAVKEGDRIYGVIRASASNHGGSANGYTVPNPVAQRDLVAQALRSARLNPRQITYVEAHGTGTALGDPVEIRGLSEAFRQGTPETGFCRVGSLKGNMGHLEAAAGIASLSKVLLQMRHQQLAPSLHASELNPSIDFSATPFTVQPSLERWHPVDCEGRPLPRRAAISSFGAGGSNAHLIVEEPPLAVKSGCDEGAQLIVLSARNEDRLREMARRLDSFLQRHPEVSLRDMAFTLQVGRQAMEERLVIRAASLGELRVKLAGVLDRSGSSEGVYRGCAGTIQNMAHDTGAFEEWMRRRDLDHLGQAWAKGARINWSDLYLDPKPNRVSLPLYPFARVVIPAPQLAFEAGPPPERAVLHPLAQRNTSTLNAQRFTSILLGREFFLAHHMVEGRKMLPAAACLEMARAAVEQSLPPRPSSPADDPSAVPVFRFRQVVWVRPLCVMNEPVQVHVALRGDPCGLVRFEIQAASSRTGTPGINPFSHPKEPRSAKTPQPVGNSRSPAEEHMTQWVHVQGSAQLDFTVPPPTIHLAAMQAPCSHQYSAEECYAAFAKLGIDYGPGLRGIERLYAGPHYVLVRLRLPDSIRATASSYHLHPSLIDAAFQASIGFGLRQAEVEGAGNMQDNGELRRTAALKPCLPYAIEAVEVFQPCVPSMWAVIRRPEDAAQSAAVETFDLDLCDDQGCVRVRIGGFAARVLSGAMEESEKTSLRLLLPDWESKEAPPLAVIPPVFERRLILCCGVESSVLAALRANPTFRNISWMHVPLKGKHLAKDFHDALLKTFEAIQDVLQAKVTGDALIQVIMGSGGSCQAHSGLVGMLRTAHLECPRLYGQLIQTDAPLSADHLSLLLIANAACPDEDWIRYQGGRRQVVSWSDAVAFPAPAHPWKTGGVYLITGGLGGLGRIFAEEIARRAPGAMLVLLGRSEPGEDGNRFLGNLRNRGVRAEYRRVDLRQREQVRECIQAVLQQYGAIHGILHAAGVLRDQFLLRKTAKDIECVLAPKVLGAVNLDEATRDVPMELFVLFSSGAALGNPGQGDYAAANAFLDGFARYRNERVEQGTRRGVTISINWPYWKDGGMRMDAAAQRLMSEHAGLIAMDTQTGLEAFYRCLAGRHPHVLVLHGAPDRLPTGTARPFRHDDEEKTSPFERERELDSAGSFQTDRSSTFSSPPSEGSARRNRLPVPDRTTQVALESSASGTSPLTGESQLQASTAEYLQRLIAETLKISPDEIKIDRDLSSYGLDSIIALEVNNRLEKEFPRLSNTLFFEYASIQELAGYFLKAHRAKLEMMLAAPAPSLAETQETQTIDDASVTEPPSAATTTPVAKAVHTPASPARRPVSMDEIIQALRLEVLHPPPRPSPRRSGAEKWPGWHTLFQSFAIFDSIQPEFSFSRLLAGGEDGSADASAYLDGQIELRRLLFHKEDLRRIRRVVDLGCGRAADLIELALSHPSLQAQGLTLDEAEAAFAHRIIRRKGLENHVRILVQDNTRHEYEPGYDLAFSIQVMHFIPDLDRQRHLFRKLASALQPDGVLLMAEFVGLLAKPMRDPVLNTTVHTAREWAALLGENDLLLGEVVDLSAGVANFLHDPHIERHLAPLGEARRVEIRKLNRQAASLENHWIRFCAMRVLRDSRAVSTEQRIRENLERLNQPTSFHELHARQSDGAGESLYQNLVAHFQDCVEAAGHPFPASQKPSSKHNGLSRHP